MVRQSKQPDTDGYGSCFAFPCMSIRKRILVVLTFLCFLHQASAQSPLPEIAALDNRDTVFRQLSQDVETNRRYLFSSRRFVNEGSESQAESIASLLTIYLYTPREGEDIFRIAARSNIPYASLASLNRFSHKEDISAGQRMLIPSIPGIFVSETPDTALERLMYAARSGIASTRGVSLSIPRNGRTEHFLFIPGDDFSQTERIFFLNVGFQFPLRSFRLTSAYGLRMNPVTGRQSLHQGLDLAAPEGAEVYATRSGIVTSQGEDGIYGKYIIISHENNWISLYGHLSQITATLNQTVKSGTLVGRVGSTGQSTGPHLHFELKQGGQSRDPARLLRLFEDKN